MISKTKIKIRTKRKSNPEIVETIRLANKNAEWKETAKKLSGPTKQYVRKNLKEIEQESKPGETIIILGKVLATGRLSKKIKLVALEISNTAKQKLNISKTDFVKLKDEIKNNPQAKGVTILK